MENSKDNLITLPRLAWGLSLAGFLPFGVLAVLLFFLGSDNGLFSPFFDIFKIWSAIILSFLGGIRWGVAITPKEQGYSDSDKLDLVCSVIASIIGWVSLLLPDIFCIVVLLIAYSAHGAWDSWAVRFGKTPYWFGQIRITLTLLVVSAHLLVLLAMA